MNNHEFRKVFDPAASKAGVGGLTVQELRHSCASLAIRLAEANIKTVQRLLDQVARRLGAECVHQVRTDGSRKIG
jgi:integrase